MALSVSLSASDLAALLCSRICHDLISPVGAINNALELYDEDKDMRDDAIDLMRMSARNASARLQFSRLAFGAAGSAGMQIDTGDAEKVAMGYIANEKSTLHWSGPRLLLPKNTVKLLLNMVLIANATIPRGGDIHLTITQNDQDARIELIVEGKMLRVPPVFVELNQGGQPEEPLDAHSIQPYYTLLLAQICNKNITIRILADKVIFEIQ